MGTVKEPSGTERRTAERIQTHHHVVFSESRALGPLRTGVAYDRSSGGLRIITPHPEPLGTTLLIELRTSADSSSVLLLEGRVVHITPAKKGQHAMGIRLIQPALRPGAALPVRERRAAAPAMAASVRVSPRPVAAPMGMAPDLEMTEAVTFRRIEDGGRPGSWVALLAILALVVILILLIVEAMRERERVGWIGLLERFHLDGLFAKGAPESEGPGSGAASESKTSTDTETTPGDTQAPVGARRESQPHRVTGVAPAVGAPELLDEFSGAATFAGAPPELRGSAPLSASGFAAMLAYADRAAARGEAGLARAVVRRAMARSDGVPGAWVELGAEYRGALDLGGEIAPAYPLSEEIGFDAAGPSEGMPTDVRIEVDTSDHLMRVWRSDQALAEFPVGLGRDGATPHGEFRIGSKARRPDWYHGGRVVPAGDPGNPIGEQWLGLARDGARTGIGIHPTAHPSSIGADQSLGCVRMRPEDAEALYRLVPLGTRVTIHP